MKVDEQAFWRGESKETNQPPKYALKHGATGLYLKADEGRYSLVRHWPTLRPMSAISWWLGRMAKPQDWDIVEFDLIEKEVFDDFEGRENSE